MVFVRNQLDTAHAELAGTTHTDTQTQTETHIAIAMADTDNEGIDAAGTRS